MPAKSEKQRRMAGADLARKREGKKTKTKMSEKQLRDFAKKPEKMPKKHMMMSEAEHKKAMKKGSK